MDRKFGEDCRRVFLGNKNFLITQFETLPESFASVSTVRGQKQPGSDRKIIVFN